MMWKLFLKFPTHRQIEQWILKKVYGTPTDIDLAEMRREIELLRERERKLDEQIAEAKSQLDDEERQLIELKRERSELMGRNRLKAL